MQYSRIRLHKDFAYSDAFFRSPQNILFVYNDSCTLLGKYCVSVKDTLYRKSNQTFQVQLLCKLIDEKYVMVITTVD